MENRIFFSKFFLDKEKDIVVDLYRESDNEDEIEYVISTPNHHTGNLITNLAKVCKVETKKGLDDNRIIVGTIPASINADGEDVFVFRIGGIKIANIYKDGKIEIKAKIPAINKILMSQTKSYKLSAQKTIVKAYILKKSKFKTDLHTHMNAILVPDVLIALGIKHQIRYPLYLINKLNLKITDKQSRDIERFRKEIEAKYEDSGLTGKAYDRKIKDETYINFADLILNNLANAEENIIKIRNSLTLMKDGQAVFTNLEKLYFTYRYTFTKGKTSRELVELEQAKIDMIPDNDVKRYLNKALLDMQKEEYKDNTLLKDKLLWIAREYASKGTEYVEIASTDLVKLGDAGVSYLKNIHEIMPAIEAETGTKIRFLAAIRRVGLDSKGIKDAIIGLKSLAKSPYIVGSDIIGEEINDIMDLKDVIKELVEYTIKEDKYFTIRIHAGENDSFKDNVKKSIECVRNAVPKGARMPRVRIGHGLYIENMQTKEGQKLIEQMKEMGAVLEFQLSSNVRLNNLIDITKHPIKNYLDQGIKCVQGTDGFAIYGTDPFEEQLALQNLLDLTDSDFRKMREVEDEILSTNTTYFEIKEREFAEFLDGRDFEYAILDYQRQISEEYESKELNIGAEVEVSENVFKEKIVKLPFDKFPVVIAGGSFNSNDRETVFNESAKNALEELIQNLDDKKAYFVIGPKMQGYEKAIVDLAKKMNKKFEINAIIPKVVTKSVKENLLSNDINGVCVSTELEEKGIYKSFNYEIFERRDSIVLAFDGNTPAANLIQEAKNGKGKSKIYVNKDVNLLSEKAKALDGYVVEFDEKESIADKIFKDYPELKL